MLLGSRGGEDWLARGSFGSNVYQLPGLDPQAATDLAERILEEHGATRWRKDGSLSPDVQRLLLCLAPFTGVLNPNLIERYTAALRREPPLARLSLDRWPEVMAEAKGWGLLAPDPNFPPFLRLQPTLPYFLRNRLAAPDEANTRQAIEAAFREFYDEVVGAVGSMLKAKEADARRMGQVIAELEYENSTGYGIAPGAATGRSGVFHGHRGQDPATSVERPHSAFEPPAER